MGCFKIDETGKSFTGDYKWTDDAADAVDSFIGFVNEIDSELIPQEILFDFATDKVIDKRFNFRAFNTIMDISDSLSEVDVVLSPAVLKAGLRFSGWGAV